MPNRVAHTFARGPNVAARPVHEARLISPICIEIRFVESHIHWPHWPFVASQLHLERKPSVIPEVVIDHADVGFIDRIMLSIPISIGAASP